MSSSYKLCYQLLVFIALHFAGNCYGQTLRKRSTLLMGGRFELSIVAKDTATADRHIDTVIKEISRIEALISDWKPDSQVSAINRNSGLQPVKVDREVFALFQRAINLSIITNGAFDISFAAMEKIWKFDGSMSLMPSDADIRRSVSRVGYKNIILDSAQSTVFLRLKGMKVGFGALGEGYAADRCRALMLAKGIRAGIVNATGDMSIWGTQPTGKPWTIGLTNPFKPNHLIGIMAVSDGSVTTSGSYQKYALINGKRYSHIINPVTGYPATGLCSVTVFGPSAEVANGFSTSLMVLGEKAGLELLISHPEYSCIMISDKGRVSYSANFNRKLLKR